MYKRVLLLIMTVVFPFFGQTPWPDTVISVTYGVNAGFGQDYFPDNILGPPDTSARASRPSSAPEELLSLGYGGEIILGFTDNEIYDGPGKDFTVFENVFLNLADSFFFRETAIVSVSADGVNWFTFPFDTLTGEGLAGLTPTNGDANPLDPEKSGGDGFDLRDSGLEVARFIKITDAAEAFPDGGDLFSNDNGFDLDAVAAINSRSYTAIGEEASISPRNFRIVGNYPNPFNPSTAIVIQLATSGKVELTVYNVAGQRIAVLLNGIMSAGEHRLIWNASGYPSGVYMARLIFGTESKTRRMILIK